MKSGASVDRINGVDRAEPCRTLPWARTFVGLFGFLLVSTCAIGCSDKPKKLVGLKETKLAGVELRLSIQKGSPLTEPLRLRVPEWEARNKTKVVIEEAEVVDSTADVAASSGEELARLGDRRPLSDDLTQDVDLLFLQFPYAYRSAFGARNRRPIAIPLAAEVVLLWYRADLFVDKALGDRFQRRFKRPLAPPESWSEYALVAKFLQEEKAVKFGCAEATSPPTGFFARAASYFVEPQAFLFDPETARPRLDRPEFERALREWKDALAASPAAVNPLVDDHLPGALFSAGEAAMVLSSAPPIADPQIRKAPGIREKIGVAPLPGGFLAFDSKSKQWVDRRDRVQTSYLGATGHFLSLSSSCKNPPAAEALMLFLASVRESAYLAQGARHGLTPIRPELLNESARFGGYGLTGKTVGRYFELVREGIRATDWAADPRFGAAASYRAALAGPIQDVLTGRKSVKEALATAQQNWLQLVAAGGEAFLNEYRQSLGFAPLAP